MLPHLENNRIISFCFYANARARVIMPQIKKQTHAAIYGQIPQIHFKIILYSERRMKAKI